MKKVTYKEYYHALNIIELFLKQIEEERKIFERIPNGDILCRMVRIGKRTKDALEMNGIKTINELIQYSPLEIKKLRGMRGKLVQELVDLLKDEFNYDWENRELVRR